MVQIRMYKDAEGRLMAQSLHDTPPPDDSAIVFRMYMPIGNHFTELLFTDMTTAEAQELGLRHTDRIILAMSEEGTRIGLADESENYYMLVFKLHPLVDKKYGARIATKLSEAVERVGGWLNTIVLTVGPHQYRYDVVVKDEAKTREAIATVLKREGQVKDFIFKPNDF